MINHPDPTSLVGRRRHPVEWAHLADTLGVPTHRAMCHPDGDVPPCAADVTWCNVLDGEPMSCVRLAIIEHAAALASLVEQRLIGFAFATGTAELCGVSPIPPLVDEDWQTLLESLR